MTPNRKNKRVLGAWLDIAVLAGIAEWLKEHPEMESDAEWVAEHPEDDHS